MESHNNLFSDRDELKNAQARVGRNRSEELKLALQVFSPRENQKEEFSTVEGQITLGKRKVISSERYYPEYQPKLHVYPSYPEENNHLEENIPEYFFYEVEKRQVESVSSFAVTDLINTLSHCSSPEEFSFPEDLNGLKRFIKNRVPNYFQGTFLEAFDKRLMAVVNKLLLNIEQCVKESETNLERMLAGKEKDEETFKECLRVKIINHFLSTLDYPLIEVSEICLNLNSYRKFYNEMLWAQELVKENNQRVNEQIYLPQNYDLTSYAPQDSDKHFLYSDLNISEQVKNPEEKSINSYYVRAIPKNISLSRRSPVRENPSSIMSSQLNDYFSQENNHLSNSERELKKINHPLDGNYFSGEDSDFSSQSSKKDNISSNNGKKILSQINFFLPAPKKMEQPAINSQFLLENNKKFY